MLGSKRVYAPQHAQMPGAKRWVCVCNNWTEDDFNIFKEAARIHTQYSVCGQETGEMGTKHLQAYMHWKARKTMVQVKEVLGAKWHLEMARGSEQQNRSYCTKGGEFWEVGVPTGTKQSNLEEAVAIIQRKRGMDEVVAKHAATFVRHCRGLRELDDIVRGKPRTRKPFVVWLTGDPGSGKSYFANTTMSLAGFSVYRHNCRSKWWPNYKYEDIVVLDDIRPDSFNGTAFMLMLDLCDEYPTSVEYKGGERNFNSKCIFITSVLTPEQMFMAQLGEPMDQLLRRVDIRQTVHIGLRHELDVLRTQCITKLWELSEAEDLVEENQATILAPNSDAE